MATIYRFEDLEIWQNARKIYQETVKIINTTDLSKDYKLRDQMKDSSGSIMDNIAEGFGRGGRKEFLQFLSISKASTCELGSQYYRCEDHTYITAVTCSYMQDLLKTQLAQTAKFMEYLKSSPISGQKFKDRINKN